MYTLQTSHVLAVWQHCLTCTVKRIIVICVCLNCAAEGESVTPLGFDILCSELLSVLSLGQSISAATQPMLTNGEGRRRSRCAGTRSQPSLLLDFCLDLQPALVRPFPSEQVAPRSSSRPRGSRPFTQTAGSDGASTHGQHP